MLFGLGFGQPSAALNVYAAHHFNRRMNWMHASYGLGATTGPLLVTLLLSDGLTGAGAYGTMAAILAVLGWVFVMTRRRWDTPSRPQTEQLPRTEEAPSAPPAQGAHHRPRAAAVLSALTFTAVETGIESGAGIWGYIFLTAGRGLTHDAAGVAVSAYWAMMFVGRAVLGPVAERIGSTRVLGGAVVGVSVGAALMTVPGPVALAVIGMMTLGLAAAPIFPLFTLTTSQRVGVGNPTVCEVPLGFPNRHVATS